MSKGVDTLFLRNKTLAMKIHETNHYTHRITNERCHCHYVAFTH